MKRTFQLITIFMLSWLIATLTSCGVKDFKSSSQPVTHEAWDTLLQKHVSPEGKVNYKGFIQDSVAFNKYLTLLKNNHPNKKNWNKDERLAYWINVYNAFTVKLIVDHYPVVSIKDIKNGIPFVNTVWDIKFIEIEGATYDLNNIEHGIIRDRFDENRIHFAVNCASISCPKLANRAFVAERLNEQLDQAAKDFIFDITKNQVDATNPKLSKIFSWYRTDFNKKGESVRSFINRYSEVKIREDVGLKYLDYDWGLNGE